MFRCALNTPEVYSSLSRDFQLFCNVFDASHGMSKAYIDSLIRATSTSDCDTSLLPLLCSKIGLFIDMDIDGDDLRMVLCALPQIIRNKGSIVAMQWTINLLHRYFGRGEALPLLKINKGTMEVEIHCYDVISYERLLVQMLQLIAPAGMSVTSMIIKKPSSRTSLIVKDTVTATGISDSAGGVIYSGDETYTEHSSDIRYAVIEYPTEDTEES